MRISLYLTLAHNWLSTYFIFKTFPDNLGQYVKGFGQDRKGEIHVLTSVQIGPMGSTGKVYKLVDTKEHDNQGKGNDEDEDEND